MRPKEASKLLKTVDEQLQQIRKQLIRCEPLDSHILPRFERITETLRILGSEREKIVSDQSARQLLESIRSRTVRANMLLESAADFYCGSGLARPFIESSYTPDGNLLPLEFGGRLSLQG